MRAIKALALLLGLFAAPLAAQTTTPFVFNANGQKVQSTAVICVDQAGNYQGCASSGSGGGGGAVTAASGAYALGSIVDMGTGASPGSNTLNGRLAAILVKQPAFGVAGTSSADVVTVQGSATGTPQPVTPGASAVFTVVGSRSSTIADGSGTLTTAATSQQVFAANTTRAYLMCQNPITATETLFVNIGTAASTAGGSIELAPGGTVTFQSNFIPTGIVYVTAATVAHRWICKSGG